MQGGRECSKALLAALARARGALVVRAGAKTRQTRVVLQAAKQTNTPAKAGEARRAGLKGPSPEKSVLESGLGHSFQIQREFNIEVECPELVRRSSTSSKDDRMG